MTTVAFRARPEVDRYLKNQKNQAAFLNALVGAVAAGTLPVRIEEVDGTLRVLPAADPRRQKLKEAATIADINLKNHKIEESKANARWKNIQCDMAQNLGGELSAGGRQILARGLRQEDRRARATSEGSIVCTLCAMSFYYTDSGTLSIQKDRFVEHFFEIHGRAPDKDTVDQLRRGPGAPGGGGPWGPASDGPVDSPPLPRPAGQPRP